MSIHHREDRGTWQVRWRENGRQRSRQFKTKAQAEAFNRDRTRALTFTLGAHAGVPFPVDVELERTRDRYIGFFENHFGEQLVYVHERGSQPVLYHADLEWDPRPVLITEDEQRAAMREVLDSVLTTGHVKRAEVTKLEKRMERSVENLGAPVPGLILDEAEQSWLRACMLISVEYAAHWSRAEQEVGA
jgi:hypothetical protein